MHCVFLPYSLNSFRPHHAGELRVRKCKVSVIATPSTVVIVDVHALDLILYVLVLLHCLLAPVVIRLTGFSSSSILRGATGTLAEV